MDVIGELIKIGTRAHLPLPWYSRGHLGLESGTSAWVGFTRPKEGFPPDIIISPYNLRNINRIRFFSIEGHDKHGFISQIQAELKHHNISMSESVTTIGRDLHRAGITLELKGEGSPADLEQVVLERLRALYGTDDVSVLDQPKEFSNGFRYIFDKKVNRAQICIDKWYEKIRILAKESNADISQFDISRLIISSNTDYRFMRFMVPKTGTMQVYVGHTDQPAAAKAITSQVASMGLNILAHRISPTNDETEGDDVSTLVMTCEPSMQTPDPFANLKNALEHPDVQMLAGTSRFRVDEGTHPLDTLYVQPKGYMLVGMPTHLREAARGFRQQARDEQIANLELEANQSPKYVFISHKFHEDEAKANIILSLKKALNKAGCYWLEAPIIHGAKTTETVIKAKMWSADAIVAVAFDPDGGGRIEGNQGSELGFYEGQRKRRKIICSAANIQSFKKSLTNYPDPILLTYEDPYRFTSETETTSIFTEIDKWVRETNRLERGGAEFE